MKVSNVYDYRSKYKVSSSAMDYQHPAISGFWNCCGLIIISLESLRARCNTDLLSNKIRLADYLLGIIGSCAEAVVSDNDRAINQFLTDIVGEPTYMGVNNGHSSDIYVWTIGKDQLTKFIQSHENKKPVTITKEEPSKKTSKKLATTSKVKASKSRTVKRTTRKTTI